MSRNLENNKKLKSELSDLNQHMSQLGPEPLSDSFNSYYLKSVIQKSHLNIELSLVLQNS